MPIGVLTNSRLDSSPNIVLDNIDLENVGSAVQDENGKQILGSSGHIDIWATGRRYNGAKGESTSGAVKAPPKASRLLDNNGKLFYRPRPQYEDRGADDFIVATDHGCHNDATGDNADAINAFLLKARDEGKIAYFPAGIYR